MSDLAADGTDVKEGVDPPTKEEIAVFYGVKNADSK